MSQLKPNHQYVGRDGYGAQMRRFRALDRRLPAMPESRARLERWLDTEPAAPLSVRTKKRYIVLHMASRLSEQTGATVPEALERLLAKLEGEQARLPSTNQYGFLKANAEYLTI